MVRILKCSWLSRLVVPGSLLCSTDSNEKGIKRILSSCGEGFLSWKAVVQAQSKTILLEPSIIEKGFQVGVLRDLRSYRLASVVVRPVEAVGGSTSTSLPRIRLGICPYASLLVWHAQRGFRVLSS
eukprot:2817627-Amphidinium_carterae.1